MKTLKTITWTMLVAVSFNNFARAERLGAYESAKIGAISQPKKVEQPAKPKSTIENHEEVLRALMMVSVSALPRANFDDVQKGLSSTEEISSKRKIKELRVALQEAGVSGTKLRHIIRTCKVLGEIAEEDKIANDFRTSLADAGLDEQKIAELVAPCSVKSEASVSSRKGSASSVALNSDADQQPLFTNIEKSVEAGK